MDKIIELFPTLFKSITKKLINICFEEVKTTFCSIEDEDGKSDSCKDEEKSNCSKDEEEPDCHEPEEEPDGHEPEEEPDCTDL